MAKASVAMLGGLEVRVVKDDEKTNNMLIRHNYVLSHVAQYAMELFRHELSAVEPVRGAGVHYQPHERTSIEHSVQRACDGAERLFAEMSKRRWLVQGPSVDELVETPSKPSYGLHGSRE